LAKSMARDDAVREVETWREEEDDMWTPAVRERGGQAGYRFGSCQDGPWAETVAELDGSPAAFFLFLISFSFSFLFSELFQILLQI
jgi:hypothetical protein